MVVPPRANSANQRHQLLDFGRGEAGHDLVEQQQFRLGRERLGDLQPLEIGEREIAREALGAVSHAERSITSSAWRRAAATELWRA